MGLQLAIKVLFLGQTVVVARLYGPEPLGVLTLLLLVTGGYKTATSLGLDRYLLQSETDKLGSQLNAAFTLTLGGAALGVVLLWLTGPAVLAVFDAGEHTAQLRWMSLLVLLQALLLPATLWERRLRLFKANLPGLIGPVVFSAIAFSAAVWWSADVNGLVLAQLGSMLASVAWVWSALPRRPMLVVRARELQPGLQFGAPLLGAGLLGFLVVQGDDLLVRWFLDDRALGLYAIAFYLPAQLLALVQVIERVAVSTMADFKAERSALKSIFSEYSGYIAMLTIGAGVTLLITARLVVQVLYGEEWLEVVPLVRLFSLAFIIRGVTGFHWQALAVLFGRTRYVLGTSILSVLFLAATAPFLIWKLGLLGGAVYSVLQLMVLGPVVRFPLIREILGDLSFLRTAVRPAIAGSVAFSAALLLHLAAPAGTVVVVLETLVFVVCYIAILARFEPLFLHGLQGIFQ